MPKPIKNLIPPEEIQEELVDAVPEDGLPEQELVNEKYLIEITHKQNLWLSSDKGRPVAKEITPGVYNLNLNEIGEYKSQGISFRTIG